MFITTLWNISLFFPNCDGKQTYEFPQSSLWMISNTAMVIQQQQKHRTVTEPKLQLTFNILHLLLVQLFTSPCVLWVQLFCWWEGTSILLRTTTREQLWRQYSSAGISITVDGKIYCYYTVSTVNLCTCREVSEGAALLLTFLYDVLEIWSESY